jgi:DNA-binding NarL/FixJ family response regulator
VICRKIISLDSTGEPRLRTLSWAAHIVLTGVEEGQPPIRLGAEDELVKDSPPGSTNARPLRVVVADDHPFYREGLARLLRQSGVDVVAEVPNGEAAVQAARDHHPDVVVMDLNMPGLSGSEATRRLADESPDTHVLVLTVSAQEEDVTDAVLAGARGYVLKDGPVEEVVAGIEAAAAGHSLISPRIAHMLLRRVRESGNGGHDVPDAKLSGRELQVLGLMAEGKANHEIAEALVISSSTVRNHIANILLKLQVHNRVEAAVHAVRHGLV